jgi:hypothetical protein
LLCATTGRLTSRLTYNSFLEISLRRTQKAYGCPPVDRRAGRWCRSWRVVSPPRESRHATRAREDVFDRRESRPASNRRESGRPTPPRAGASGLPAWRPHRRLAGIGRDSLRDPLVAQLTFLDRHAPLVVPLVRPPVQSHSAPNLLAHVPTLAPAAPGGKSSTWSPRVSSWLRRSYGSSSRGVPLSRRR